MPSKKQGDARHRAIRAASAARHKAALKAYAELVPLLRHLRDEGLSYGQIANHLNEQGVRTRYGARWLPITVWKVLARAGKEKS
jgi:hypothetical protein